MTSAWNALAWGRKRWALYPPHAVPPGVTLEPLPGGGGGVNVDCLTPLQWFLEVYPSLPPELRPVEFLQEPGARAGGLPPLVPARSALPPALPGVRRAGRSTCPPPPAAQARWCLCRAAGGTACSTWRSPWQ
jgi:hypothetical protein